MKTLKQIKTTIFASLFLVLLIFTTDANAQDSDSLGFCSERGLISFGKKEGTVYSLAPGIYKKFEAHYNRVDVSVLKKGGRARTQVNIYLNDVYQGHLTFENGNYKRTETFSLNNAKGKMIKVEIVNQSATNRFDYICRVYHSQKRNLAKFTKTLMPGEKIRHGYFSCSDKYKIIIKRIQGDAKLRFVAHHGPIQSTHAFYATDINPSETTKVIKLTSPDLRWRILNIDENNFAKIEVIAEVGKFKTKKTQGKKVKKYKKVALPSKK